MWQRLITWCIASGLSPLRHNRFGVTLDDPARTPPDQCRYDACIEVGSTFAVSGDVGLRTLSGGLFACVPFTGTAEAIDQAWRQFYNKALPAAGYNLDRRPPMEFYAAGGPIDENAGTFSCDLCVAVTDV